MPQPIASLDLDPLFRDPGMFDSRDAWRDAGFDVLARSDPGKVMVARHASAAGYLFKKYTPSFAQADQSENYQRRIEGAQRVRGIIADRALRGVVTPQKWLHELPRAFGSREQTAHVLIVEEVPLLDHDATKRAYRDISKDTLRDLCVVLHALPGLDSIAKNLPFTQDGRIAFIDTEHWDRHRDRRHLKLHIGSHLSSKRYRLAEKTLEKLAG